MLFVSLGGECEDQGDRTYIRVVRLHNFAKSDILEHIQTMGTINSDIGLHRPAKKLVYYRLENSAKSVVLFLFWHYCIFVNFMELIRDTFLTNI